MKSPSQSCLLLLAFAGICNASLISISAREMSKNVVPPAKYDYEACLDNIFDNAQLIFNKNLGLDSALNWKNATGLAEQVHQIIDKGVDSFIQVCNARQAYAYQLGNTYPFCLNRFYLLNRDATPFTDAVTYVHMYKHLEFICSTGFDVYQMNLPCIITAEHTDGTLYQACFYKFQQIVQNNPYRYCEASESFVLCVRDFFTEHCGAPTGWVQCEKERIGFAYDCPGLSC
ncbi:unnamed protein product [Cylicocyclus nassatus]|uniref:Uncharacterized protein n=1 Tax=Cylicocyclus nassatus TaxID=53992 RepID=A0AA36M3W3_CYLNA|nr:unnamed protein product [Cylicocyclus nassatus]